ncbi:small oligopeptide transporter, OPT family [Purpureocillium lavendulum]|uniref:Small oligopeptide transporter, OPT family n=1 Tax=Purpureocillium lavendulum TaxID=1247861 RepID=A0AB34FWW6_9HYPO|nr:small oligopeptide transporter, OPT family [Purpureocillium lavendulum]
MMAASEQAGDATFDRGAQPPEMKEARVAEEIVQVVTTAEAHAILETLRCEYYKHIHDYNFPSDTLQRAANLIRQEKGTIDLEVAQELVHEFQRQKELILNNSPYPEVRAVVDPTDDPATPANTFRAWFLGSAFAILGTGIDQFFSLRYPSIFVVSYVAQLLSYPCGVFMAKALPTRAVPLGPLSFTLNPGPFNQKEHMVITIMSNVAYGGYNGTAYVTYMVQVLKLDMFFGNRTLADSAGWQILMALSTQLIGYGAAGVSRRILVYPAEMIWPRCLAQIALNKALHHDDGSRELSSGWKLSRNRFLLYAFGGMFLYFWLPNYLFNALSIFNWMTWISPENTKLAIITGSICGMGINPIPTLDWNWATSLLDPIVTPFFSTANVFAGAFIAVALAIIPVYWSNLFNSAHVPINSNYVFDNLGQPYNISRVLNEDFTLDEEAYKAYSVPYLSAASTVTYACNFALYLAALVHVGLYNHRDIARAFKNLLPFRSKTRQAEGDIHNRLMKRYNEAPHWWYMVILAVSFAMACCACTVWDTSMPVWGIVFALAMCFCLQVPIGIILAMTNVEVTLNVIAEFIGGYVLSGKPIANMMFKAFGYITCAQSIQFSAGLKMAHYCKIPPRLTFAIQTWATILGAFVSIGVNQWQLTHIKNVCAVDQEDRFSCPGTHSYFKATVIMGAIGPKRIFGPGQIYNSLTWGFLAGAMLPVPVYLLQRRFPDTWVRYVHIPVLFFGPLSLSPYNLSQLWPAFCLSWFFNLYIRRRMLGWWTRYAYVLTSAFASAIAVSGIVIFFAVQFRSVAKIDWWGNRVSYAGVDGGDSDQKCVLKQVPEGGF